MDETTQATQPTLPNDDAPTIQTPAVTPAGKGRHWQQIADYLNEQPGEGDAANAPTQLTGDAVTLTPANERQPGEGDDDDGKAKKKPTAPGVPAPIAPFNDGLRRAYLRTVSLPTPGDLGPLIFALIVFGLAIIPVGPNGETRLQLLWGTVTGAVTIPGNDQGAFGIVTGFVQQIGRQIQQTGGLTPGVGAGPDGMPGYVGAESTLGGTDGGYSRLY